MSPQHAFSGQQFDEQSIRRRRQMVEQHVRARGVSDQRVLEAMMAVPRELFLPPGRRHEAYDDRAVPIDSGQTISQPFIVAYMTELLHVAPHCKVLEVGTGSGYQVAILAQLAREVHTIERFDNLRQQAERTLMALPVSNVFFHTGDGTLGLPSEAPFDRIIVTAAAPLVPQSLIDQLADHGVLVMPVGGPKDQAIVRIAREGSRIIETTALPCRFVPLVGREGCREDQAHN
ncbi:MAG: protein-L-isoaspartate(D-aspartate) O-methyltransferase [Planctomycetes bacterium]|nr:protein-L-isoaspartate(D-aspartate) O-methyltransferase [Planctomycetota bacterium]MBI3835869.1 protein-L-isoaspartate(D-aspartate) O-methyltransferase [Planctomycetota bacterium]